MYTSSRSHYTETQQDANWDNLSPEQRKYFNRLASEDPERTGQAFFEDTVPPELQDNPGHIEIYLNGGTVEVPVEVHSQGRGGSTYETVEYEVSDKDWSHDVSTKNGGSGSADNGRFEDASTNRARQERNTTASEQEAADSASDADVDNLLKSADEVAEVATYGAAFEAASSLFEVALDGLLPILGGVAAAKKTYEHFDKPADKVGYSAIIGGVTVAFLASPAGAPVVGTYVLWNVGKRGVRLWKKHTAN